MRSPRALRAGEDMADEGEREPARLWVDQAERKRPSWIAMGAVAEERRPSDVDEGAMVEVEAWAGVLCAVDDDEGGRSVCRVRAVEGARTCQRGM